MVVDGGEIARVACGRVDALEGEDQITDEYLDLLPATQDGLVRERRVAETTDRLSVPAEVQFRVRLYLQQQVDPFRRGVVLASDALQRSGGIDVLDRSAQRRGGFVGGGQLARVGLRQVHLPSGHRRRGGRGRRCARSRGPGRRRAGPRLIPTTTTAPNQPS